MENQLTEVHFNRKTRFFLTAVDNSDQLRQPGGASSAVSPQEVDWAGCMDTQTKQALSKAASSPRDGTFQASRPPWSHGPRHDAAVPGPGGRCSLITDDKREVLFQITFPALQLTVGQTAQEE